MIYVTKPFLPPLEEYTEILKQVWDRRILTNRGPCLLELEKSLVERFNIDHLLFVSNGTIAIQIAIQALQLKGEIITTPFSFVATTSSIVWEGLTPVFVDIDPDTLCISADKIEKAITPKTSAILATHVFGNPCDVEAIERIAKKYNLKVIYDAAHAFDVEIKGKSILAYGDVSTLSFHATKVFNTGEGGAVVARDPEVFKRLQLLHSFGSIKEEHFICGINGKNSEIHAALGLTNLKYVQGQIEKRGLISKLYNSLLPELKKPMRHKDSSDNYSYYPVLFKSENELEKVVANLNSNQVFPRRYFYPSLNFLPYVSYSSCPVSEDVAKKILCLPLYGDLLESEVQFIAKKIKEVI